MKTTNNASKTFSCMILRQCKYESRQGKKRADRYARKIAKQKQEQKTNAEAYSAGARLLRFQSSMDVSNKNRVSGWLVKQLIGSERE